jgi:hypothetical protein
MHRDGHQEGQLDVAVATIIGTQKKKGILREAMGCGWQPHPSFKSPFLALSASAALMGTT